MTVILDQFLQTLRESGLMTAPEIDSLLRTLAPAEKPETGEELARLLVQRHKLTKFQAQAIYQGKPRGLVVGGYTVLEELGRGGMGYVYKAQHRRMQRVVALKVLSPAVAKDTEAVQRFHHEVLAAAKLSHPNIVIAHDADEVDGVHFLVMEYVEGRDLGALVLERGPLPVGTAVAYILQAAKGLEFAHKRKIIHRDIKPSNLLLDKAGIVKILDMGLARLEQQAATDGTTAASLTQSGQVMGTIDYMSPEQAMDSHCADERSDIYSLGCTLFYLLTGRPVFGGETLLKKMMAHREEKIPSLQACRQDVPKELDAMFQKMVAKQAEDRYRCMGEVIAAIEPFRDPGVQEVAEAVSLRAGVTDADDIEKQPVETITGNSDSGTETLACTALLNAELPGVPALAGPRRPQLNRGHILIGSVAAGMGLLLLLSGIVLRLRTSEGTLVVEVSLPDAEVSVDDGKLTIRSPGDSQPVQVQVAEGKHLLLVKKGGFETFTKEFSIRAGGRETIRAELVPKKPETAGESANPQHPDASAARSVGPDRRPRGPVPPPAIAPFDAAQARKQQGAWAQHLGVPVEMTNSIGMRLTLIPPGEFTMGAAPAEMEEALGHVGGYGKWEESVKSESPQHKVILTRPIYLGVHEVTQAQYERVMGQNPSHFSATGPGRDAVVGIDTSSCPVEGVTWNNAAEFCTKLSEKERLKPSSVRAGETVTMLDDAGYRLPTEAEWEFACRAGTTTKYWLGDDAGALGRAAWFHANSGGRTHAVGELEANPFGLYDIHGNVWEWVQDSWQPTYYGQFQDKPALDPRGPSPPDSRCVIRGGHWVMAEFACRAACRHFNAPAERGDGLGFRVTLTVGVP